MGALAAADVLQLLAATAAPSHHSSPESEAHTARLLQAGHGPSSKSRWSRSHRHDHGVQYSVPGTPGQADRTTDMVD